MPAASVARKATGRMDRTSFAGIVLRPFTFRRLAIRGVATPLIANRRNVNGRSTMPANDVLSILPVAFRATDAAGIQRHSPSVGLLNDHERSEERRVGKECRSRWSP